MKQPIRFLSKKTMRRIPPCSVSSAGISLIDVVIAMALGSVILLLLVGSLKESRRLGRKTNQHTSLLAVREVVFKYLNAYSSFQNTIAANASFACIAGHVSCPGAPYGNFVLKDANNSTVYDPTNALAGFTLGGIPCVSTSGNAPSRSCPVRADFSWSPIWITTTPGQISVSVVFTVWGATGIERVPAYYNFTLLKTVY